MKFHAKLLSVRDAARKLCGFVSFSPLCVKLIYELPNYINSKDYYSAGTNFTGIV